jgi:hypothetical protein
MDMSGTGHSRHPPHVGPVGRPTLLEYKNLSEGFKRVVHFFALMQGQGAAYADTRPRATAPSKIGLRNEAIRAQAAFFQDFSYKWTSTTRRRSSRKFRLRVRPLPRRRRCSPLSRAVVGLSCCCRAGLAELGHQGSTGPLGARVASVPTLNVMVPREFAGCFAHTGSWLLEW